MDETNYPFGEIGTSCLDSAQISEIGSCDGVAVESSRVSFAQPVSIPASDDGICFNFYDAAVSQYKPVEMTAQEAAAANLRNAMTYAQRALKTGALNDHSIELIDQAEAIMQMVLDNLQRQDLPPEFSYHMANAVNELQACTKLCSGKLQASVFDLSAAVEKLRGETE